MHRGERAPLVYGGIMECEDEEEADTLGTR